MTSLPPTNATMGEAPYPSDGGMVDWFLRPDRAATRLAERGADHPLVRASGLSIVLAIGVWSAVTVRIATLSAPLVGDSWFVVMLAGVVAAALPAIVYWLVAPAFYQLRAKIGGGTPASYRTARAVYFVSVVPAFLLAVVGLVLLPITFDSPAAYVASPPTAHHVLIPVVTVILLALGCITTFLVAWKAWRANAIAAAALFVALPWLFYVGDAIGMAQFGIVMSETRINGEPIRPALGTTTNSDLRSNDAKATHAATAEAPFAFEYPSSWTIGPGSALPDATGPALRVTAPFGTWVEAIVVADDADETKTLRAPLARMSKAGAKLVPLGEVRRLGDYDGTGRQFALTGTPAGQVQVFLAPMPNGKRVLLVAWLLDEQRAGGQRGLNMFFSSFQLTN